MSDVLLQAARDEEQRLIAEMQFNPTYRKLEVVRSLIATYEATPVSASAHATSQAPRVSGRASSREGSKAFSHIAEAQAFLREKGTRAQTREIMEALEARGVVFDSEKPIAALASTLSHSALFNNVRGKGYGLVEWGEGEGRVGLLEIFNRPEVQQSVAAFSQAVTRTIEASRESEDHSSFDCSQPIKDEVA